MQDNSPVAMARYQRRRRGVIGVAILVLACVFLFARSSQPEHVQAFLETAGILLIVTGIVGRLWSILYIGGQKSATVIDKGPYSVTRNPLYFFSSIAAAGVGALTGSVVATILFGMLCALAFLVVIWREEDYLRANLGAAYVDYLQRVPRFFPDPRLYADLPQGTFSPQVLRQTLLDGLVFFLAVPLIHLVDWLQQKAFVPVLFTLW